MSREGESSRVRHVRSREEKDPFLSSPLLPPFLSQTARWDSNRICMGHRSGIKRRRRRRIKGSTTTTTATRHFPAFAAGGEKKGKREQEKAIACQGHFPFYARPEIEYVWESRRRRRRQFVYMSAPLFLMCSPFLLLLLLFRVSHLFARPLSLSLEREHE